MLEQSPQVESDNLSCILWYGRGKRNAIYRVVDYRNGHTQTRSADMGLFYLETEDILRELGLEYFNDNKREDDAGASISLMDSAGQLVYKIGVRTH